MASLGGKSGSAPSGRHKRIREAEKARWNEGGRKEGRKGLLENRRRQRGWFGGCHHRFSMLDAPCLLAIVKGRKLNHRKLQERTTEIVESSDRREFFFRREREEFRVKKKRRSGRRRRRREGGGMTSIFERIVNVEIIS